MKKVVNEYQYNKELLKEFFWLYYKPVVILLFVLTILIILLSILFYDFNFAFLCISIMVCCLILSLLMPGRLAKIQYQRLMEQSNGKDVVNRVSISEDKIIVENTSTGNKVEYLVSNIKKVKEGKNIFCLYTKARVGIILFKDGFISGTKDDFYLLLRSVNLIKK